MQFIVWIVVLSFAAGAGATLHWQSRQVAVVEEGSARDYIAQYSCWHAITTGNYAKARGCA